MTVVIVAKTRFGEQQMCVGGHDLTNNFRSLRLFLHDGSYLDRDATIEVGEVFQLAYTPVSHLTAPHVEDVRVAKGSAKRVGHEDDLASLILANDEVWHSAEELFDGCLRYVGQGTGYVPDGGPLPTRSTGYWLIDAPLYRVAAYEDSVRYRWDGTG